MKNLEYMKHSLKNCGEKEHGQYCLTIIVLLFCLFMGKAIAWHDKGNKL